MCGSHLKMSLFLSERSSKQELGEVFGLFMLSNTKDIIQKSYTISDELTKERCICFSVLLHVYTQEI